MSRFTNAALDQDVMSFKNEFDSALANKVADALAQKKLEVAQTFFNEPVDENSVETELEEVEQIDEQSPSEIKAKYYHDQFDKVKPVKAYDKEGKLVGHYRSMAHAKQMKPGHTYKMAEEVEQIDEGAAEKAKELSSMQQDKNWQVNKGKIYHPYYDSATVKKHVSALKTVSKLKKAHKDGNYFVNDKGNVDHPYYDPRTVKNHVSKISEEVEQTEEGYRGPWPKEWTKQMANIPRTAIVRDKDKKGVYTSKTVNGKEVSRKYDTKEEVEQVDERRFSSSEVKMAHTIGKEFEKKGVGKSPYAVASGMVKNKPAAAKKAYKTILAKK